MTHIKLLKTLNQPGESSMNLISLSKSKQRLVGVALICLPTFMAAQTTDTMSQSKSSQSSAPMSKSANQQSGKLSAADQKFVKDAAQGGMAEVELGKLATEKASSDDVKKFGQRMQDDHSKANDELKQIAGSKGVTLPETMNAKDKALQTRLSKLSGTTFDRAYMQAMVKDHKQDVADFTKESKSGNDSDIKGFATKTLPTLKEHLQQAEGIASSNKSKTSAGSSGASQ
jgi:putative membrane protein